MKILDHVGPLRLVRVKGSELQVGDIVHIRLRPPAQYADPGDGDEYVIITRTYSNENTRHQAIDYEPGYASGGGRFNLKMDDEYMIYRGQKL